MKTLLFFTAFPPNQKTGGQTFSSNAIKELSKEYTIDLMYFSYPEHDCDFTDNSITRNVKKLSIGKYDFLKKAWIHPLFSRRFNKSILKEIQNISKQYDVLYFDFSQIAIYSLFIKHPNKVLRMHDVICQKYERKNKFLYLWVKTIEGKIIKSFNKVFVPSIKDVEIIKNNYDIDVLYTNEYLKPVSFPDAVEQKNQFIFYGYWKRTENSDGLVWFINEVLPKVKNTSVFKIIGGGLDNSIKEKIESISNIEYLGFVDDPVKIIQESAAVIVPLFQGAGIKVKVIDSFTSGTPVIGTDLAFEGLPAIEGLVYQSNKSEELANFINEYKPLSYSEKKEKAKYFSSIYDCHHLLEQI